MNFEREKERINTEEQQRAELYNKLKAAGVKVTPEQRANITAQAAAQRIQAAQLYDAALSGIDSRENKDKADEKKKQTDALKELLEKYRDYEARRVAVKKQGDSDIAKLEAERTEENADEIDRAIEVAKEKVRQGIQAINDEEAAGVAKDNDFLKKLFGDYSSMSFDSLQNLISQAKQLRAYLSGTGDAKGITFISPEQLSNIEKARLNLTSSKRHLTNFSVLIRETATTSGKVYLKHLRKGLPSSKGRKALRNWPVQSVR